MHLLKGSISRIEFTLGVILLTISWWLFLNSDVVLLSENSSLEAKLLVPAMFGIFAVFIQASILIRRLEDLGYRKFFILIYLIPPLSIVAVPFLIFVSGNESVRGFSAKRFFGLATQSAQASDTSTTKHTKSDWKSVLIIIFALLCVWVYVSSGATEKQADQTELIDNSEASDSVDQPAVEGFVLLDSESDRYAYAPIQKDTITYEGIVEVSYSEYDGTYLLHLTENPWASHFQNDKFIPFQVLRYEPSVGMFGLIPITEAEIDNLCGFDCTTVEYGASVIASIDAFNERGLSIPVVLRVEFIQFVPRTDIKALALKTIAISELSRQ